MRKKITTSDSLKIFYFFVALFFTFESAFASFVSTKESLQDYLYSCGLDEKCTYLKQIGEGTYGKVIKYQNLRRPLIARKIMLVIDRDDRLSAKRELDCLSKLDHPNIMKSLAVNYSMNKDHSMNLFIDMPLFHMDLSNLIGQQKEIEDSRIIYFLYQMLSGLTHLHSANIMHRDLKPANILITREDHLSISDFGLSRPMQGHDLHDKDYTYYVVTRWYRAPEILLKMAYNEKVDIWSLGLILCELINRRALLPASDSLSQIEMILSFAYEDTSILKKIRSEKFKRIVANIIAYNYGKEKKISSFFGKHREFFRKNPELRTLIKAMLMLDPEKRISAKEALNSSIFDQFRKLREQAGFTDEASVFLKETKSYVSFEELLRYTK